MLVCDQGAHLLVAMNKELLRMAIDSEFRRFSPDARTLVVAMEVQLKSGAIHVKHDLIWRFLLGPSQFQMTLSARKQRKTW